MADDPTKNTPDTAAEGDGVPAVTGDAATPIPNAKAEPVTQEAATSATDVRPPLPADYEMPDDYADQDWLTTTKAWVEENPGLAILAASGIGLLAGRIVTALFPDPEPTLADRVEERAAVYKKEAAKRGKAYRKEAKKRGKTYRKATKKELKAFRKDPAGYTEGLAGDLGDTLEDRLQSAAKTLRHAADGATDAAGDGLERTKDFAEHVADAVKVALTGVVATKVDDWVHKVRD